MENLHQCKKLTGSPLKIQKTYNIATTVSCWSLAGKPVPEDAPGITKTQQFTYNIIRSIIKVKNLKTHILHSLEVRQYPVQKHVAFPQIPL